MAPSRIGLVVHPRRPIEGPIRTIEEWSARHGVGLGQVMIRGQERKVAEPVEAADCELLIAVGGDGTTLAALHAGAAQSRPVLGVACGSLGVLTSVPAERLEAALQSVAAGDWTPRALPGLEVNGPPGSLAVAINDFAIIRDGTGQLITSISVDGELYARTAGDGLIVSTQLGSSAYTMAAGGPILAPGAQGIVVTPLAHHGGVAPPLVAGPASRIELAVEEGFGGSRFEVDGQRLERPVAEVSASLRDDYATLVALGEQEPMLTGLRRRGLLADAPRILARDARTARD
jgi:NAD+ kinase